MAGSSGGGKTKQQTTTVNNAPWTGQQPFLQEGFGAALQVLRDQERQFYPGQTFVPFSNQTNQALTNMESRVNQGAPGLQTAANTIFDTAAGNYLNSNPYLQGAIDVATRPVMQNYAENTLPGVASYFSQAGRYGSNAMQTGLRQAQDAANRQIGDISTGMAFQNYGQERGRQLQAAAAAPSAYGFQFLPDQMLAQIGATREGKAGEQLQDQINRFEFNQDAPWEELSRYMGLIGGSYGSSGTTSSFIPSSSAAGGILGGALGGATLGGQIGGPWGAGIGALGGGLLGAFR